MVALAAQNAALTMLNTLTHTQSLNSIQKYAIQLTQLTKSAGESQLVKNLLQETQEQPKNQQPTQEGLRGINTPLTKNQSLLCQCRRARPVPQTGQTGLVQINQPLYPDRSEKPKPNISCSTRSTKSTLDHPSSTELVLRGFLSGFSLRVTYEHF